MGNEYYSGDIDKMKKVIMQYFLEDHSEEKDCINNADVYDECIMCLMDEIKKSKKAIFKCSSQDFEDIPRNKLVCNHNLTDIGNAKHNINTNLVEKLLNAFVDDGTLTEFKKFCKYVFVKPSESVQIFRDCKTDTFTLSQWLYWCCFILWGEKSCLCVNSPSYMNKNVDKNNLPRVVIINGHNCLMKSITDKLIEYGVKHIVVCDNTETIYDIDKLSDLVENNACEIIDTLYERLDESDLSKDIVMQNLKKQINDIPFEDLLFDANYLLIDTLLWCLQ